MAAAKGEEEASPVTVEDIGDDSAAVFLVSHRPQAYTRCTSAPDVVEFGMLSQELRAKIDSLLASAPIVLFMKGNRHAPQCGFSARVVDILDEVVEEYRTIDVLGDPELREGIKVYSSWPTIPQLYVAGGFVGGADIVGEMHRAGELSAALGVSGPIRVEPPEIMVTDAAMEAFLRYADGDPKPSVRLEIGRGFDAELDLSVPRPGELIVDLGRLTIAMDRASAQRANGLTIDFVDGPSATGFKIDNPNAPPKVKSMSVQELDALRKAGKPHLLLDVRTTQEREIAALDGSVLLDEEMRDDLEELDRSTTLVLMCHHGVRSRAAAEHCLRMGFVDVWNVEGGIDAWSKLVDRNIPQY